MVPTLQPARHGSSPFELVAVAVPSYLLGSVSPAMVLARARGVDLRAVGSGNPGAANASRALGRRLGVVVGLLDLTKGALPAAVAGRVVSHPAALVAGGAAVAGHVSSPYLRGRGGKGVATAAGAILGAHPAWFPVVLATWAATLAASHWVALASCCAALAAVTTAAVSRSPRLDVVWAAALATVVLARHRTNLAAGRPGRPAHPSRPNRPPEPARLP